MLERMQDAPEHALALKASGTVMARDVEAAVSAALGESTVGTGLVVVIDPDFDGYFAELARGLTTVSLAHRNIVRIAVVTERRPNRRGQAQRILPSRPSRSASTPPAIDRRPTTGRMRRDAANSSRSDAARFRDGLRTSATNALLNTRDEIGEIPA